MTSVRVVKAFAREDFEVERFESQSLHNVETALQARTIKAKLTPIEDIMVAIGTFLVLGYGSRLALRGDFDGAREIHRRYHPLMEINFVESNPIPVKAAMAEMGLLEPVWRLPLVGPKAENRARIRAVLESLGLIRREAAAHTRERSHAAIAH